MTLPETLSEQIDDTRIEYVEKQHGFTITGAAFTCDFESPVDPEELCATVTSPEPPWDMFGIPTPLRDDREYWKVVGTLFHTDEHGIVTGASEISFEVAPEWMRLYAKEGTDTQRLIDFLETLDDEYNIERFSFPHNDIEADDDN